MSDGNDGAKEKGENRDKLLLAMVIAVGIALPILMHCLYFGPSGLQDAVDEGKLGPIADLFNGALTPMVALASFFLLYKTYESQKEELSLTRKSLEESKLEMKKQRFESVFFNLMGLHHEIVNAIKYSGADGRQYFYEAYGQFSESYGKRDSIKIILEGKEQPPGSLKEVYDEFFEEHKENLGHYFRNLYHLMRLIDESCLEKNEKASYAKILGAQLSKYELLLLHYNCLVGRGVEHFKPLINRYGLLDNLDQEWLLKR